MTYPIHPESPFPGSRNWVSCQTQALWPNNAVQCRRHCGHESGTNGSSQQKRVRLCLACRSVIWLNEKKRKILTAFGPLKEKREEAPDRNLYRLRKWIMGKVAWIKADSFFFSASFFSARSRRKRNEGRSTERVDRREREREEESGGGTQRGVS